MTPDSNSFIGWTDLVCVILSLTKYPERENSPTPKIPASKPIKINTVESDMFNFSDFEASIIRGTIKNTSDPDNCTQIFAVWMAFRLSLGLGEITEIKPPKDTSVIE